MTLHCAHCTRDFKKREGYLWIEPYCIAYCTREACLAKGNAQADRLRKAWMLEVPASPLEFSVTRGFGQRPVAPDDKVAGE